jgi:release factor glutamine methyltransferase
MSVESGTLTGELSSARYGPVRRAIGKARYWRYRLLQRHRHEDVVLEHVDGLPLLIMPGVLNPNLMRTGAFFAAQLGPDLIGAHAEVLDMGTGSGVCAVVAARYARHVVAVDINPAAVRCARINSLLSERDDRIDVRLGDLFDSLPGRRFDVVLFNPPFIRAAARNDADRAWRSLDVAERFAAGLSSHLTPTGFALILLSTYGDAGQYVRELQRHHFAVAPLAEGAFVNEKLILLKVRPCATNQDD